MAFHVRGRAQTETFKSGELKETFGLGGGGRMGQNGTVSLRTS